MRGVPQAHQVVGRVAAVAPPFSPNFRRYVLPHLGDILAQLLGDDCAHVAQHLGLVLRAEEQRGENCADTTDCDCAQSSNNISGLTTAKVTTLRARRGAAMGATLGACMDTMRQAGRREALWIWAVPKERLFRAKGSWSGPCCTIGDCPGTTKALGSIEAS